MHKYMLTALHLEAVAAGCFQAAQSCRWIAGLNPLVFPVTKAAFASYLGWISRTVTTERPQHSEAKRRRRWRSEMVDQDAPPQKKKPGLKDMMSIMTLKCQRGWKSGAPNFGA